MNNIRFPKPPKKGDKVYLLCPSSSMNPANIEKGCEEISKLGFTPIVGKSSFSNYGGYMAGKAEIRLDDLHEAFGRTDIKGIICVRGGFASSQLLNKLDYNLIRNNPKVFTGYSDITNLHLVFNQICGLGTYHGPMVESNMIEDFNDYTRNDFLNVLNNRNHKYIEPLDMPLSILKTGTERIVSGTVIGGNLSLLVTSLGTPYEIDTEGKIIFLEDVSEEIGRIDRMLTHLEYAGKFDKCKGIIFGNFDDCRNRYDEKYTFYSLIEDFFKNYCKPVFYNFESGHAKPFLATVPLGSKCTMDTEKKEIIFEKMEVLG